MWVNIRGYEGIYHISEKGEICSALTKRKRKFNIVNGYYRIQLHKDKKIKDFLVHRLVAETFIPHLTSKSQVNHKDGNKQNNYYKNLEWVTSAENREHAKQNGLMANGENHIRAKLKEKDVLWILKNKNKYTQIFMAKKFKVATSSIGRIISGRNWRHFQKQIKEIK